MAIDPLHTGERKSVFARMRVDTRPFKHRDFRNLWLGQAISTIGGEIGTVAVPYQVYTLTGSTALVGLLGLASLVPLLVVPLSAARSPTRSTAARCCCAPRPGWRSSPGCSSLNSLLPHPQVWALFVLQALAVAIFSLGRPAMSSLAPRLVPDDEIAAAGALDERLQLARRGRRARGRRHLDRASPACRGRTGSTSSTYAASLLVIWLLPRLPPLGDVDRPSLRVDRRRLPVPEGPAGADRDLRGRHERDGLRDAERALPGDRAAPARRRRVDRRLPVRGAVCGALVGSLFSGWTSHVRRQGLGVTVAACAWGAAIAGFGFTTALWPALVLLAVAGGADFFSAVLRSTMLMRATPDHLLRPPARDRVRAGRECAEPRRPRGGRARVAHVAALLDRLRRGRSASSAASSTALALPGFLQYD